MSALEYRDDEARDGAWCLTADPKSVEARFGLGDCHPDGPGGSRCSFRWPAWARDASGKRALGVLMVLADRILGELPHARRAPNQWSLTTELTVDVIGPAEPPDDLSAGAVLLGAQTGDGFARCEMTDRAGSVVVVGTSRLVYVAADLATSNVDGTAGGQIDVTGSTIDEALGLEQASGTEGLHVTMSDPGSWVNDFGILHGGVAACLAEIAASRLVAESNPRLSTAQVHTTYLRPGPPSVPYTASAEAVHVGRRFAVVRVAGRSAGGELCNMSTVTARLSTFD